MTEGNMAVMLTDINLTPNNVIGRRLYEFSCTAYEIEDGYSLDILDSLGIINIRNDNIESAEKTEAESEYETITRSIFGQIYAEGQSFKYRELDEDDYTHKNPVFVSLFSKENSINYNQDLDLNVYDKLFNVKYNKNSSLGKKYQPDANSFIIKNLKIQFESKPKYYMNDSDGNFIQAPNNVNEKTILFLGYKIGLKIVGIDEILQIFVNEKGFYQIPSNLEVTDVIIYDEAAASVVYQLDYNLSYNTSIVPEEIRLSRNLVGQITDE
jgi:hypothetical protein